MSSFNIYDNYSSFNHLINRTELLEEKTYKAMVKGTNLGPELKKYKTEDGKGLSATSRIKNLILISALVRMNMLDEDVAKALRKKATSSTYITNTLKELAPKVHAELFDGDNPGSEKVVKYVQDNIKQLLPFAVKNVTRGEFEIKEVDTEEPDDSEAKELEDEVSDEVKIAQGLMSSGADRVKLDFDDVDVNIEGLNNKNEVAAKVVDLINTTNNLKAEPTGVGLNIEGPIGAFGSQTDISDMLTRIITSHFPDVSESEVKVTLNTNQLARKPMKSDEEDYEEGPETIEPKGPTNEYEEDINDVEEDAEYKGIKQKFSPKYAKKVEDEFKDHVKLRKGNLGVKLPPGNKDEIEDYKKRGYVEDNEFDPDEAHHYPGYDPNRPLTAEQEKRRQEVNAEFKEFLRTNPEIEDNEFDDFDIGPQSDENVPDDYEEVLKAMITKDKENFAKNMIEDEEELKVESTTAAYLTEQKQSDKRNKKAEVKNQSFKERYKPKTHWQLEELRRYGL